MNKINLKWKYWLVALGVVAVCACSKDTELAQMTGVHQEVQNATRTANWYTKEVTLDAIGTLEAKVTEAMAGEELTKLEKLVVSGPIAAADFNYLRNSLTALKSLDIENASIKESDEYYYPHNGRYKLKNDTICSHMFTLLTSLQEIKLPRTVKYIDSNII